VCCAGPAQPGGRTAGADVRPGHLHPVTGRRSGTRQIGPLWHDHRPRM
jgi:hypothetical protein